MNCLFFFHRFVFSPLFFMTETFKIALLFTTAVADDAKLCFSQYFVQNIRLLHIDEKRSLGTLLLVFSLYSLMGVGCLGCSCQ